MRLPNAEYAVIDPRKLYDYLLNTGHQDGSSKARFLALAGYTAEDWARLEYDLRSQHLAQEAEVGRPSPYGQKYEIVGPLVGPNGVTLMVRSIWIIRHGLTNPGLVTLIPEGRR